MFCVIFEVAPIASQWDEYLAIAKGLRPALEQVPGFVRNVRFRSLCRQGWVLSLSDWDDEKALIRWRTRASHHAAQERRAEILQDYHLRVGEVVTGDDAGGRRDLTAVGDGTAVTLLEASLAADQVKDTTAEAVAKALGYDVAAPALLAWELFEAIHTPGDVIVLSTWQNEHAAQKSMGETASGGASRNRTCRAVRVIRDYGKYDRREAPQFYPDVPGRETLHF